MTKRKITKILLCITLLITITFSTGIPSLASPSLSDIANTEFQEPVTNLVNLGIISGNPDGTFKPYDNITRSAFAKIITIMLGGKNVADSLKGNTQFADVSKTHWATGFINYASEHGLIKGSNGDFRPEDPISYAEAITILLRALGYEPSLGENKKWPDSYLTKSNELGLTVVQWNSSSDKASRGNIGKLCWKALNLNPWNSSKLLLEEKFPLSSNKPLKVHFIDVGQADCIFIETSDKNLLIDAGNNSDSDFIINYIKALGINKIDNIIGTHPHSDHIGSMDSVINTFEISKIYLPKVTTTTKTFEDLLSAIEAKSKTITPASAGMNIDLGENITATVLAPNGTLYDDLNNYSVVVRLVFGNTSFLFTGDAEDISENEMLSHKYNVKSDVLKVGHHGSSSSTSTSFLAAVSPSYAIISVGENDYGHPTQETLDKLTKSKVQVFRTDEAGSIVSTSNGYTISFDRNPSAILVAKPIVTGSVIIENINLSAEVVTIKNASNIDIDMTGWKMVSVKGNQVFTFPDGFILKSNAFVNINSGASAFGDGIETLKWATGNIWNNDGDPGELYDASGKVVSTK